MKSIHFDPEKDLAPMPFSRNICQRALDMKKNGLIWRPQVGCFVWDPDEFIKPTSPFPGRIYFILSLARFLDIFDTLEQVALKLVWLPTWHQAKLLCRQLGIADDIDKTARGDRDTLSPADELLDIYEKILETLR
ncbi:MAG: hypothetical protein PVF37_07715 [Desulfobacterales bacterium]|jgi:hypothetical protein